MMLKLVGQSLTRNIYMVTKYHFLTKYLLTINGKIDKFTVERTGRHYLNQVIKINIQKCDTQK